MHLTWKICIRSIKWLLALALFIGLYFFMAPFIAYKDEVYVSGMAYGFFIGSPKETVYEGLPKNISSMSVSSNMYFTDLHVSKELAPQIGSTENSNLMIQTFFNPDGYSFFNKKDYWIIYFEGNYKNYISFQFCEGKLCEIRRHVQHFELP